MMNSSSNHKSENLRRADWRDGRLSAHEVDCSITRTRGGGRYYRHRDGIKWTNWRCRTLPDALTSWFRTQAASPLCRYERVYPGAGKTE